MDRHVDVAEPVLGDEERENLDEVLDSGRFLQGPYVEEFEENFELFQIATGKETSVNELYSMIKNKLEEKGVEVPEPKHGEERKGEIYRNYADIGKSKEVLNYSPQVEIEEGIEETVDWFLNNSNNSLEST